MKQMLFAMLLLPGIACAADIDLIKATHKKMDGIENRISAAQDRLVKVMQDMTAAQDADDDQRNALNVRFRRAWTALSKALEESKTVVAPHLANGEANRNLSEAVADHKQRSLALVGKNAAFAQGVDLDKMELFGKEADELAMKEAIALMAAYNAVGAQP